MKKNENNVGFVGTSIESLSEQLSRFLQVWLDSRKSTWEHLDKNLSEDLEKQKQIAEHLENAKSSAEEVSLEMRNVPENLSTNLKIEEAAVNKLEAERNKILDEMDSIRFAFVNFLNFGLFFKNLSRNKREKLMKQELKAANALRAVDQKLAETRREAEKAILENVNVVTEKADDRLRSLAQMLSSIVEINSSLVKSAEEVSWTMPL